MVWWWVLACLVGTADRDGDGYAESDGDCHDGDERIHPGADETCGDEVDNDCDGTADGRDAVDAPTWYLDADGDGAGGTAVVACEAPEGASAAQDDCDDLAAGTFPGAPELCNGVDDDCDDQVDEDLVSQDAWLDADGDGYGDPKNPVSDCTEGSWAANAQDCDDQDPTAYPGAPELLDGVDNDCDERIDGPSVDQALVTAADPGTDCAGRSVTAVGDQVVIGGFCAGDDKATGHIWSVDVGSRGQVSLGDVPRIDGQNNDGLGGFSVALDDNTIAVSATLTDWVDATGFETRVYAFELPFTGTGSAEVEAIWSIRGFEYDHAFGGQMAVGDMTGDDVVDLVATARGVNEYDGAAFVFAGPFGRDLVRADASGELQGETGSFEDLAVVAWLGDIDGDGIGDVATGGYAHGGYEGVVRVVRGPIDGVVDLGVDADYSIHGTRRDVSEWLGSAVAGFDYDNDGYDEIVAASYPVSRTYVFEPMDQPDQDVDATLTLEGGGQRLYREGELLYIGGAYAGFDYSGTLYGFERGLPDGTHAVTSLATVALTHTQDSFFGSSVALTDELLWVGAPGDHDYDQTGAVYGFGWGF